MKLVCEASGDRELANIVKGIAGLTGRTMSEVVVDALLAYNKLALDIISKANEVTFESLLGTPPPHG